MHFRAQADPDSCGLMMMANLTDFLTTARIEANSSHCLKPGGFSSLSLRAGKLPVFTLKFSYSYAWEISVPESTASRNGNHRIPGARPGCCRAHLCNLQDFEVG